MRVIDDLQWLSDRTTADTAELLGPMAQPGIRVLEDAARTLDAADAADRDAARAALASSSGGLRTVAADGYRSAIVDILAETDDAAAIQLGRTLLHRRTMGAAIGSPGNSSSRPQRPMPVRYGPASWGAGCPTAVWPTR